MTPEARESRPAPDRGVTTLDLLKALAVVTMVADHIGLYVLTDQTWWRAAGRPTIVVFGFLVGFAGPRAVPPRWVFLGVGLTLLEGWTETGGDDAALDTLISLALARVVLPAFVTLAAVSPWLLAPATLLAGLVAEATNEHLEYGTEVLMFGLFGLACRLAPNAWRSRAPAALVAAVAVVAYLVISRRHFAFDTLETALAAALVGGLALALLRFEARPVAIPSPAAGGLRWIGRRTLEIYAAHLALFMLASWWFGFGED